MNDKAYPCIGKHRSMETILTAKKLWFENGSNIGKLFQYYENYKHLIKIDCIDSPHSVLRTSIRSTEFTNIYQVN